MLVHRNSARNSVRSFASITRIFRVNILSIHNGRPSDGQVRARQKCEIRQIPKTHFSHVCASSRPIEWPTHRLVYTLLNEYYREMSANVQQTTTRRCAGMFLIYSLHCHNRRRRRQTEGESLECPANFPDFIRFHSANTFIVIFAATLSLNSFDSEME